MRFRWSREQLVRRPWNRYVCRVNDSTRPVGFIERNGANPQVWDVTVYLLFFGAHAMSLREGKKMIEDRLRERAFYKTTQQAGTGEKP